MTDAAPPDDAPRLDRSVVRSFSSFEEADRAVREERWALTPQQRVEHTEWLRSQKYPDARTPPRLQRVFGVAFRPVR